MEKASLKKNIQRVALIIGVLIIPLMYSYFYLNAFWDPYQRLDKVPVAVVNLDEGAVINDEDRNLGDEIADKLKEEKELDFRFTDEKEAKDGVRGNEYYASITIPKDFSSDAATVGEDTKKLHGNIIYSANQKRNYLAAQILENAMPRIKQEVNSKIDEQIVETISDKVKEVPEQLGTLDDGLEKLDNGAGQLKDGTSKLSNGANVLAQGLAKLNGNVPVLKKGAVKLNTGAEKLSKGMKTLDKNSTALNSGADQVAGGAGTLKDGLNEYTGGVSQAKDGAAALSSGIKQYTSGVSKAGEGASALKNGLSSYTDGVSKAGKGASDLKSGLSDYTGGVSQAKSGSLSLKEGIQKTSAGVDEIANGVSAAEDKLKEAGTAVGSIDNGANNLNNGLSDLDSNFRVDSLMALADAYANGSQDAKAQLQGALSKTKSSIGSLSSGASQLKSGTGELKNGMGSMNEKFGSLKQGISDLQTAFGSETQEGTLVYGAAQLDGGLGILESKNEALNGGAAQLEGGLGTLTSNNDSLNGGAAQLDSGLGTLSSASSGLTGGTDQLKAGLDTIASNSDKLNSGAAQLAEGSKSLKSGVGAYTKGVGTAKDGADQLADGTGQLTSKIPVLASGVNKLDDGGSQLASGAKTLDDGTGTLKAGISTASDGVSTAVGKANTEVKKLDGVSDYAKEPVKTKTKYVQPVANYGSAFAPYFMGLSLWVGGLLIFFGLYFDYNRRIKMLTRESHRVIARALAFGAVSVGQGILLAFVIKSVLHITVNNPFALYWSSILVAMTFTAIIMFCIVNLGDIGKFVVMLLLILQLTSCAGTFPIETQNAFFRAINPFLPMTYSTQLFKEAISGTMGDNAANSALILLSFFAAFMALTMVISHKKIKADIVHIAHEVKTNGSHA